MVPASDSFYDESVPLRAIIKLTVRDVDKVIIEELRGHEKCI